MKRHIALIAGCCLVLAGLVVGGVVTFQAVSAAGAASAATDAARASAQAQVAQPVEGATTPVLPAPSALLETPSPADSAPVSMQAPDAGEAFGLVYVPRLRSKAWAQPLLSGVEDPQLDAGIGHFPNSALPGQIGNFAIAGHRATHGEPFAFVDQLRPGDEVIVRTVAGWFVYALTQDQIVRPEDVWVVDPVPWQPGAEPMQAIVTIVTCEPRWGSTSRWIWWGTLEEVRPVESPPPAIVEFGAEAS